MSELTVASRYAKSIIDLAGQQNLVEVINKDMQLFLHTLRKNPQLKAVLANPIVSHAKKIKILDEVFTGKVNGLCILFYKLMINKSRGEVLFETANEYINQYNIIHHIVKATVVTPTALSAENKQKMIAEVEGATGNTVLLETRIDPALIGGFVLTVGDRQIDTSIASDLKRLKKEFAGAAIAK